MHVNQRVRNLRRMVDLESMRQQNLHRYANPEEGNEIIPQPDRKGLAVAAPLQTVNWSEIANENLAYSFCNSIGWTSDPRAAAGGFETGSRWFGMLRYSSRFIEVYDKPADPNKPTYAQKTPCPFHPLQDSRLENGSRRCFAGVSGPCHFLSAQLISYN